jgi:GxGYxYP putative glycoside hydrolase C-terminal domain/GxGYxY sequence motif in domain of unknown function N-terminal
MSTNEIAGLDWSANRLLPAFQTPLQLDIYDIRTASREAQLTITTLAGLINRPQPKVYLLLNNEDDFWFNTLFTHIQHENGLVKNDDALDGLLIKYGSSVQGLIIYNPNFPDSINIATTLAGQRDGIIVSPAQAAVLQEAHKLPVLFDLNKFDWKTRLQAYQWAYDNLLKGASSRLVAGLDPKGAIGLQSFLVATRSFVYWLDSRDILPDITNVLSSEHRLMQQIFSNYLAGATHLGWFIDEGSGVSLTSDAAITVLATDLFSNLEVFTGIPASTPATTQTAAVATVQAPKAESKVYVSFTVSDGDNLQYCQHRLLRLWNDHARGSFPLGWTISPVLMQGTPAMAAYYLRTATANDELIAGPSGAGYMFPSRWPAQHLPAFLENTGKLMQQMNLSLLEVLEITPLEASGLPFISGLRKTGMAFTDEQLQQTFAQALAPYGIQGILSGSGLDNPEWKLVAGTPIYQNLGLAGNPKEAVDLITKAAANASQRPLFLNVYILAWSMTPSDIKQTIQQLGSAYEVVTPGTLLAMIRQGS